MNITQVFTYLEENVLPENGGRIQFLEDTTKGEEVIRIFIYDSKFFNYKYIFSFIKELVDGKPVFKSFVKSGFSGVDHKLEMPLTEEIFSDLKGGLHSLDAKYMKSLQDDIVASVDIPTVTTLEKSELKTEIESNTESKTIPTTESASE